MLYRLQHHSKDEGGFTLIELLVVILIIGILAAIAIPSFLNQKSKANDASAKVQARTAETAAETYSTDHEGSYKGVSVAELEALEPTLKEKTAAELTAVKEVGTEGKGYEVISKAANTGNTFKIERTESGEILRTCKAGGKGACPSTETW